MADPFQDALLKTLQAMTDRLDRMERRLANLEVGQRHTVAAAHQASVAGTRQDQALAALQHKLTLPPGWLPPVRGMAASPDFLLALADLVLDRRPARLIEVGSGLTTLILAKAMAAIDAGHLFSLEHRTEDVERTGGMLADRGLSDRVTLIHAPLEGGWAGPQKGGLYYRREAVPDGPFDLVVIDGPPAWEDGQARYPAGEALLDRMGPAGIAVLDDADRPGERDCVERWHRERPTLKFARVPLEKGMVRLWFES